MKSIQHHFHSPALGLFIIRLVAGVIFIYSGITKLADMHSTIASFAVMGFGAVLAWIVVLVELLGGVSLVIGYWTKFFSFLLVVTMLVAIIKVTGHIGIRESISPILLLTISIAILFSGCGSYSVCRWNHKDCKECSDGTCACGHGMK